MWDVTEAPWESRHSAWVAAGNRCIQCEAEHERGFHGPTAGERWSALLVDCACWWDGTVLPVLRRWARLLGSGDGLWDHYPEGRTPRAEVEARELAAAESRHTLVKVGEALELALDGHLIRGPVQSVPEWERRARELEEELSTVWTAWAESLLGECPLPQPSGTDGQVPAAIR